MTRRQEDPVAVAFDEQRGRLVAVAYQMLGSRADAEDAVQEAWLRLARQDAGAIRNLPGWLTTVVGRVCIDMLRARRARPETSLDDRLPHVVVPDDDVQGPEDEAVLAESVGLALLVVLDTLRPAERLAFVLHDTFAVPYDDIAVILDRSRAATKMLASRARRKVQDSAVPSEDLQRRRAVVDAFLAAARDGDFDALVRALDPEVVWRGRSARGVVVRRGAAEVAARFQRAATAKATARPVLVDGDPGIVAYATDGRPVGLMACAVVDDRIVEIRSVTDAERLAALDLPPRDD